MKDEIGPDMIVPMSVQCAYFVQLLANTLAAVHAADNDFPVDEVAAGALIVNFIAGYKQTVNLNTEQKIQCLKMVHASYSMPTFEMTHLLLEVVWEAYHNPSEINKDNEPLGKPGGYDLKILNNLIQNGE